MNEAVKVVNFKCRFRRSIIDEKFFVSQNFSSRENLKKRLFIIPAILAIAFFFVIDEVDCWTETEIGRNVDFDFQKTVNLATFWRSAEAPAQNGAETPVQALLVDFRDSEGD